MSIVEVYDVTRTVSRRATQILVVLNEVVVRGDSAVPNSAWLAPPRGPDLGWRAMTTSRTSGVSADLAPEASGDVQVAAPLQLLRGSGQRRRPSDHLKADSDTAAARPFLLLNYVSLPITTTVESASSLSR
jgi:hypothetical protein